mgnify:CR=1 FL=1
MCRKKTHAKKGHTHNNGNGKEPKRPTDQDSKKPTGFGKGYTKENPKGKREGGKKHPNPKSFQEKLAQSSAEFCKKHYQPRETFLENPELI